MRIACGSLVPLNLLEPNTQFVHFALQRGGCVLLGEGVAAVPGLSPLNKSGVRLRCPVSRFLSSSRSSVGKRTAPGRRDDIGGTRPSAAASRGASGGGGRAAAALDAHLHARRRSGLGPSFLPSLPACPAQGPRAREREGTTPRIDRDRKGGQGCRTFDARPQDCFVLPTARGAGGGQVDRRLASKFLTLGALYLAGISAIPWGAPRGFSLHSGFWSPRGGTSLVLKCAGVQPVNKTFCAAPRPLRPPAQNSKSPKHKTSL